MNLDPSSVILVFFDSTIPRYAQTLIALFFAINPSPRRNENSKTDYRGRFTSTLINVTAALPTVDGNGKPQSNTSVTLPEPDVDQLAYTCDGLWQDSRMLPELDWHNNLVPGLDLAAAGVAISCCVDRATKENSDCFNSSWCTIGAIFMCGLAVSAVQCVAIRCWETSKGISDVLASGRQGQKSTYGTMNTERALGELQGGMQVVIDSSSFSSLTNQYRYRSGKVQLALASTRDLYLKVTRDFKICDCSSARC